MRFDFRLVPQSDLKEFLREVYKKENVKAEEEALDLIASAAEGSVRDMLSLADRCMNFSFDLKYKDVLEVLGASGKEGTRKLFKAIADCDVATTLATVDELCSEGKAVGLIAKDLCSYARDLLLLKTSAKANVLGSREDIEEMKAEAETRSVELLVSVVTIFSAIDTELRYSVSPRIVLECAALKAAKLVTADYSALEERIARLEKRLESGEFTVQAPTQSAPQPTAAKPNQSNKPMDARSVWGRLLTHFRLNEAPQAFATLNRVTDVEVKGNKLIVRADSDNFLRLSAEDMVEAIKRGLSVDGAPFELVIDKKSGDVDMDKEISLIKKLMGDAK
ncbi:MAG: hypothetical protein K2N18_06020, partial [Clostridia bacterium]|nr:hypothetical protein [Clostridia bacterium]